MNNGVLDIHAYASSPSEHYHLWLQKEIYQLKANAGEGSRSFSEFPELLKQLQ